MSGAEESEAGAPRAFKLIEAYVGKGVLNANDTDPLFAAIDQFGPDVKKAIQDLPRTLPAGSADGKLSRRRGPDHDRSHDHARQDADDRSEAYVHHGHGRSGADRRRQEAPAGPALHRASQVSSRHASDSWRVF